MTPSIVDTLPFFSSWVLSAIALIFILITLLWLMRPMIKVGNYKEPEENPPLDNAPKVSVVVCTANHEEELFGYLDNLTQQDYPDYEIIVVSDSTSESTEILAECCSRRYDNVYVTFVPPESHSLSRRKLALTLGMKAAKGEIVVTTVSTAEIPSARWLSEITAPFRGARGNDIKVSLGYSHIDFTQMKGLGRWYKEFDSVMTDARWLGAALGGKPYRGDGFNIAISRSLFFEHKGYSRSLGLQGGDDDVFIHEVSTPDNTATVFSPDSILSIGWGEASSRIWSLRKEQYDYTSHWLPQAPFVRAGLLSAMQWMIPLICVISMYFPISAFIKDMVFDAWRICASFVPFALWVAFILCETLIYRRDAERMQATRLWWALPLFMLIRPIVNLIFRIMHRGTNNTTLI